MTDKVAMHNLVERIPTHHETKKKCFEKIANLKSLANWIETAFTDGHPVACKSFLWEAEQTIEEIRVLVGGSKI